MKLPCSWYIKVELGKVERTAASTSQVFEYWAASLLAGDAKINKSDVPCEICNYQIVLDLFCHAKAKYRNFDFCRKLVTDIFGTFKTSFIMYISILSQFSCFSEKIMGRLNRNFKKPRRNQRRTPYDTSYRSFTLFGMLKLSFGILPLFNFPSKESYGAGLELCDVLPFFFTVH